MKHISRFDCMIYGKIQNFTCSHMGWYNFFKSVSEYSSKFYFGVYILVGLILLGKRDTRLIAYIAVPMITLFASLALRRLIKRKRPPLSRKTGYCMPSNHSGSSMIISLACLYVCPVLGFILVFCSLLTGISRVFAGVHYPLDIFSGWALALVIYLSFTVVFAG